LYSFIRHLKDLINKDLLVFSACLSFFGSDYGTSGAAIVAGVKSVIDSLFKVNDSGTMVAMTSFYQQLLGNGLSKTKGEAAYMMSVEVTKVKKSL
jgi:CHAT domain-containing protein